jgi:DNA invertase Pin-like site-specific DNA recombinase
MTKKTKSTAFAYLRTSSAANVGADKDSEHRQHEAIKSFAARAGYDLVGCFYDAAVSGKDPIETRPGFSELLDKIEETGTRVVIVEDASRLARELVVQELGLISLIDRKVRVFTASGEDLTETDDPFKVAMRQIAGAFAQLEKARLVAKLRHARDRKRAGGVKVEGRKSHSEARPEVVARARALHRKRPKGGTMSLRKVSAALAAEGFLNERGAPFNPNSVASMLACRS